MSLEVFRRRDGERELPEFITARLVRPIQQFVHTESSSGLLLLVAAIVAIAWANSPWGDAYFDLWHRQIVIDLSWVSIDKDLGHLVNDGLMTVFFFVVGLEIKRELVHGELASRERAMLPVAAAIGGMAVPALIYVAFNAGDPGERGWGIPMATDIAFALGVLALLGDRVPFGAKVFLLALAIVDDLGAILVIAVFYTEQIAGDALRAAIVILGVTFAVNRLGVRTITMYWVLGVIFWLAVFKSGIHATLAGVILATLTPSKSLQTPDTFEAGTRHLLDDYATARERGDKEALDLYADRIEKLSRETESPLDRLERSLHPWVSFLVVPLFALANAGLRVDGDFVAAAIESSVSQGVALGLVAGKVIGIALFTFVTVRTGYATLPRGMGFRHVIGVALLGGIGFTVSLFITDLAFEAPQLADEAKAGVLGASVVAALAGLGWLAIVSRPPSPSAARADDVEVAGR